MSEFYYEPNENALSRNGICGSANFALKRSGSANGSFMLFWLAMILLNAIALSAYSNGDGRNPRTNQFPPYGPVPSCSDVGTARFDIESAYGVNSTYRSVSVLGTSDLLVNYSTGAGLANVKSKIIKANGTMTDGPAISISPTTNNNSETIFIKGLTDGNVLVYWYSGSSSTGLTDAYFKIYNQSGSEVVAATKINTSPGSLNRFVESAQLSNGNIIFTWATGGTDYSMRRFKLNGTPVDNVQLSATDLAGMTGQSMYACKIAANGNGRFMLLMDSYSLVYRAMIFENDAVTPVQVGGSNSFVAMTAGTSGNHVDKTPNIIALPNNKFLLACRIQPTSATASRSLAFKVYNDDGSVAVADKTVRQIYSWGSVAFTPVAVADGFYMRYFYNDLGSNGPSLGKVDYFEKYDFNCNFISDSKSCLPTLTSKGNVYPFQDADDKMGLLINDKINESDADTEKNVWVLRNNASPCTAPTITGNPPNRTICAGGNTSFNSTATGATGYQWQVNTGSGFADISNGGVYSGATTNTLTITSAVAGMNGYLYRCVALNGSASCTANSNAATLTVSSISLAATMQTNVACNGGSNGAATVTASGGVAPYSYSWSPSGGTSATATGLAAGSYTVTVTDNLTCSATKTYTILQPSAITATTSQVNVSCNGGSNGSATVTVSGGTGTKTYSWSPSGGTAATATGLVAGNYTCTITDANSCSITKTFTITQPSAISTTASQVNVSCNGGNNGSATVTATGGAGSYTYSWSPSGGTAATATGLAVGNYTCTITDANSCTATRNFTITQPVAMTATTSQTNVACNGGSNGSATVTVSGGTGTKTYSWSPSGGTAATATGLVAGNYTCTITDANSCSITKTFTITQPSAISTTASQVNVSCNGGTNGSATVTASGGVGSYTYSWSPSGGIAATATGLAAGNYTCTITDANSCTATRSFTITQPVAMTATTSQTNVACYGGSNGSATVTVSGGTGTKTYSWSPSGGTAATATGLVAGNYTCTITDANSCTITKTFTITQPSAISAAASQVNVSCNGGSNGSATVTATGGAGSYTYSWSPSGGTAATATGLAVGNYTCTITDANSCTATRSFTITQPVAMTATTSQTNVACNGGSNGSATVTVSGGTGTKTYSWSPSGGTAATATGLVAGNYTCTITDANSCSITKTFTITQPSAISTTTSQVNVSCNGGSNGSATVIASGGVGSYTYSWSPSGGTAATATGLAAGTYTVTVTDANSCTATKSFTITQPTALSVSATKTSVSCNGGSDGTATAAVTGGTGSYTYSWSPSGGTGATATGLSAGTYTVTVIDANECSATQSVTITEPAKVTVSVTPGSQTICSGEQTNIALSSIPSGASFSWSVSTVNGNVSGAAASSGTSIQQTLTGSGVIKYVITPANNTCAGQEKEVVITVNALTNIEMHPADKSIYDEETAKFAIEANNASAYKWQVDAGNGFVDLSDDEHYSGTSSYILKISNAIGSMNGNLYRCVATGNCAPVSSNSAKLTVKVRTAQTISFAAADTKVYGDDNYTPAATTNSGLELNYSSSDESVAEIVSGQIHIKKAGQVTLTASQPGNDDYKPAASVQQVLTISKKTITVSLAENPAISKVYDTHTGIKLSADNYILKDVETGDDVIVKGTASFEDSNAGDDKTIQVVEFVLNGEQAENYELTTISATVKGAIKRKEITLSLQSSPLISKTYNASATATLAASNYILDGILGEDDVTVASGKAVYSDKKAGADKEITVTDFVLGGAPKDNYTVTTQSAVTSGTIKAKEIILSLADAPAISKVYDGTALATVPEAKYQLQGIETGDDVTVKGTAIYNSKNAGGDKTVTVNEFILNGEDADNYHLSTTELTAEGTVEKATLTVRIVSDATPITKEYDGTAKANISANNYVVEGIVGEDEVVLNKPETGVYENKHGGSEKEVTVSGLQISGEDADNYQLESTTISGSVGKITRKVISVTADSKTKVYGQADPVLTYVAEGKLEGDELPGRLERTAGKNVGNYKVEQGSLTGGDDYLIEWFQNASFTITPAPLTITAEDKAKKQGAANPAFTFSYNGLAEGDQPTDLEAQPVAATNATTGSPIGYYEIEASGAASANYAITYAKGKLTVTPSRGDNFNVKVWSSSPDVLQVRIFTTVAQKSAIILYTETGQQVILQQHQLSVGINSFSVPVGHLASSTYVLSVAAEKFKDAQKVKVK